MTYRMRPPLVADAQRRASVRYSDGRRGGPGT